MLILTRRVGETLMVGDKVALTVLGVKGNQVRIGVNAPKDIPVHREEIYHRIQREKDNNNSEQRCGSAEFESKYDLSPYDDAECTQDHQHDDGCGNGSGNKGHQQQHGKDAMGEEQMLNKGGKCCAGKGLQQHNADLIAAGEQPKKACCAGKGGHHNHQHAHTGSVYDVFGAQPHAHQHKGGCGKGSCGKGKGHHDHTDEQDDHN